MPRKKKVENPSGTPGTDTLGVYASSNDSSSSSHQPPIAQAPSQQAQALLSQFQKWTPITIHRSKLKNAPYNPRVLGDDAKKKLLNNIKRVGLIDPPIWNETSGNLVGGHQRMKLLDSLMGTDDYLLTVARVEMDEKTEMEQNVFLNNHKVQGDWDSEKLEKLYKEYKIDIESTGFDTSDIYKMYGGEETALLAQPELLESIAQRVRDARAQYDKTTVKNDTLDDPDFFLIVPFGSYAERKLFLDGIQCEDNKFVAGRYLAQKLGISMEVANVPMLQASCDFCSAMNDVIYGQKSVVCKKCKNPFPIEWEEDAKPAEQIVAEAIGTPIANNT